MARRRSESTTSECSSEEGGRGEDRQRSSRSKRRRSKRKDSSPPRSRSRSGPRINLDLRALGELLDVEQLLASNSASRPAVSARFSTGRRVDVVEHSPSRSRSRSPVHHRSRDRRERRERSDTRSRSRSRSSTPARYEAHFRRLREYGSGSGRGGSSRGGHYGGLGDYHHHNSSRGERGERFHQNYAAGARRGGFIRSRNMIDDGRDDPRPSRCISVFGMPPWVREYDMRNMFEPFGEVDQLNVVINRHTGQCRGYGFVYFTTVEDATRARTAMRDAKIDGIPIRVDYSLTDQRRPSYRDNL